jgi:hypothetical protein
MAEINIEKLKQSLQAGDAEGTRAQLDEYFKAESTAAERGEALTVITAAYLELNNSIDEQYKAVLEDTLHALQSTESARQSLQDRQELNDARKQLE